MSRLGDTLNSVALVILVCRLTGSRLDAGAAVIFEIVPVLAFGLVAGAVVDRLPRVAVLIGAELARAGIAVVLSLVCAAAFGLSGFSVFFNPAVSSVLPSLIGPGEVLGANSAAWQAVVVSQIALAPAAGVLVATSGAGPAFLLNAAPFLVSAWPGGAL